MQCGDGQAPCILAIRAMSQDLTSWWRGGVCGFSSTPANGIAWLKVVAHGVVVGTSLIGPFQSGSGFIRTEPKRVANGFIQHPGLNYDCKVEEKRRDMCRGRVIH